jgi:hypothetical protein
MLSVVIMNVVMLSGNLKQYHTLILCLIDTILLNIVIIDNVIILINHTIKLL